MSSDEHSGLAVALGTMAPLSQTGGRFGSLGNLFESLGTILVGTSLGSTLLPSLGPMFLTFGMAPVLAPPQMGGQH